jgi:hypothetical protein
MRLRPVAILTAGVGGGLFAARWLGEIVPDSLAASVSMFAAGAISGTLVGLLVGYSWGRAAAAARPARHS